jgi:hypothetical protein
LKLGETSSSALPIPSRLIELEGVDTSTEYIVIDDENPANFYRFSVNIGSPAPAGGLVINLTPYSTPTGSPVPSGNITVSAEAIYAGTAAVSTITITPATLTNVQWFINGSTTALTTGNGVTVGTNSIAIDFNNANLTGDLKKSTMVRVTAQSTLNGATVYWSGAFTITVNP